MYNNVGSLLPFPLKCEEAIDAIRERDCSICLNSFMPLENSSYMKQLNCGHLFHKICLDETKSNGLMYENEMGTWSEKSCPLCRKTIEKANDVFLENRSVTEDKKCRIEINLATTRGLVQSAFLFVDQNCKLRTIMKVCSEMLGLSYSYSLNERPLPFIVDYHRFKYSPSLDPSNDKTLHDFGINNGEIIMIYHTYKF